jgi:small redox-active disulfide protein 2
VLPRIRNRVAEMKKEKINKEVMEMKIEILGTGCQKCNKLTEATKQAVAELGLDAEILKVEKLDQIMQYGVMVTPALVVNGVVKVSGKVPSKEEIKVLLT